MPLYFAVVPLGDWKGEQPPVVSSPLAGTEWVSLWDAQNRWLYLLVRGRTGGEKDHGRTVSFDLR